MAWLEVHQSLLTHRKTMELADILEIPPIYAAAHVIALWSWSLDNAPDGALHVRASIIARACQWQNDTDVIVSALVNSGFLDMSSDGTLTIHDWDDYAGRLVDKRRANAQRMREARKKERASNKEESATHVPRTLHARAGATVPSPSPNHTTIDSAGADNAPDDFDIWFSNLWSLYPKKVRKTNAERAARRIAVKDRPLVIQAIKNYLQSDKPLNGFVKEPPGFLGDNYWRDYIAGPLNETRPGGTNGNYTQGRLGGDQQSGPRQLEVQKSARPGKSFGRNVADVGQKDVRPAS